MDLRRQKQKQRAVKKSSYVNGGLSKKVLRSCVKQWKNGGFAQPR